VFPENRSLRRREDLDLQPQFEPTLPRCGVHARQGEEEKDGSDHDRDRQITLLKYLPSDVVDNVLRREAEGNLPEWTCSRAGLNPQEESKTVKVRMMLSNHDAMIETAIEKSDAYRLIEAQMKEGRS